MDQVGEVLSVKDGMANLKVRRVGGCGTSCGSCSAACDVDPDYINIRDTIGVKVGDYVEIGTNTSQVTKYMLLLYGLPLLGLIAGSILGSTFTDNEIYSVLGGVLGLILSIGVVKIFDKKSDIKSEDINYMIKKL